MRIRPNSISGATGAEGLYREFSKAEARYQKQQVIYFLGWVGVASASFFILKNAMPILIGAVGLGTALIYLQYNQEVRPLVLKANKLREELIRRHPDFALKFLYGESEEGIN